MRVAGLLEGVNVGGPYCAGRTQHMFQRPATEDKASFEAALNAESRVERNTPGPPLGTQPMLQSPSMAGWFRQAFIGE